MTAMLWALPRKSWRTAVIILGIFCFLYLWLQRGLPSSSSLPAIARISQYEKKRDPIQLQNNAFYIGGKPTTILSGAIHYFRVVPEYWEDRLQKLKAAGLNTVETYVPWNLHEEVRHQENFDGILNIRGFIETAQRLGLLVILRPGPYICSEWDLGGLPSWLLRDPHMKLRSTYPPFITAVDEFFAMLISKVEDLQYQYGGPIIAMQVENEYGAAGSDINYMRSIKYLMEKHGVVEPLFTSDNNNGLLKGYIPGVFMTTNFKNTDHGLSMFETLKKLQPGKPNMVMEYWTGWFDHWGENHKRTSINEFTDGVNFILGQKSSINLYMFHGGTNFGFMNGANFPYTPTITSYDYDSPLSESGDTTDKYLALRNIIAKTLPSTNLPPLPDKVPTAAYGTFETKGRITLNALVELIHPQISYQVMPMEMLDVNHGEGQGYGFTLYRRSTPIKGQHLLLQDVHDRAQVFADSKLMAVRQWDKPDREKPIKLPQINCIHLLFFPNGTNVDIGRLTIPFLLHDGLFLAACSQETKVLDILVENCGRANYGNLQTMNTQRKGLLQPVRLDGRELRDWDIYALDFKSDFIKRALMSDEWEKVTSASYLEDFPALYSTELNINNNPKDTFISMEGWTKGIVFVNSFNLGRYWNIGPQKTLYLPAPLLKQGINQILIFELHAGSKSLTFKDKPELG